ncbi:fumarylacetoacetate hydrolase family protein [Blastococcus saxobsidens]|nr:fumarylacetoacetate hydrolase family protein [Blastococcus saxobsidens]
MVDVESESEGRFGPDPQSVFPRWSEFRSWAGEHGAASGDATASLPENPDLAAPVPRPAQVFAVGLNYQAHVSEAGRDRPDAPVTFTKFPSCLTGPYTTIALPGERVDWEVELVVVMGETVRNGRLEDAWGQVAGLMVGQDLSEREVQLRPPTPQFSLGKSFPQFGPTGPVLVTPDEFSDPDDLAISCAVNGEEVQSAKTSQMIFSVPEVIVALSAIVTLLPGDLIFTGTPSGVGNARKPPKYLTPGDELTSYIENIGTMRHTFTR